MTREQQMQDMMTAAFWRDIEEGNQPDNGDAIEIAKTYERAYQQGWQAADQHPQWIPVEDYEKDKLPPLKDKEDQYGCSVSVLFVVNLDGVHYINKGSFDYDTGVWHSIDTGLSYTKEQVTHWMPLPEVPRKEEEK